MSKKLMKYRLNVFLLQRVSDGVVAHNDYLGGIANSTLVLCDSTHQKASPQKGTYYQRLRETSVAHPKIGGGTRFRKTKKPQYKVGHD